MEKRERRLVSGRGWYVDDIPLPNMARSSGLSRAGEIPSFGEWAK